MPIHKGGFRAGKSTEDAVLTLADSLTMNNNKKLNLPLLTLFISTLLRNLECIGVHNLFTNYFENRFQCIRMSSIISEPESLHFGVLGPTLFLIYINDLYKLAIQHCKINMYGDDTVLLMDGLN